MIAPCDLPGNGPRHERKGISYNLQSEYPRIRVVCMSGYTGDAAADIAMPFIGKPFTPKLLLEKVRVVLQQA